MYSSVLGMSLICAITAGPLETVHVQMEKACENRKWQKLRHPDFTDCREKILRGPLKAFIECRAESSCKTYMCILPWVFLIFILIHEKTTAFVLYLNICDLLSFHLYYTVFTNATLHVPVSNKSPLLYWTEHHLLIMLLLLNTADTRCKKNQEKTLIYSNKIQYLSLAEISCPES